MVVGHRTPPGRSAAALADMYRAKLPIRSMYRVDRFGYSSRVHGGDDHTSMAAGNTSGFNCRDVVNRPGVRSPHSYGRAIDINTWENPYRSQTGLVPNSWWHVALAPAGGLALQPAPRSSRSWREQQHPLDLRQRRHPALRRRHLRRVVMAPGCTLPAAVACD